MSGTFTDPTEVWVKVQTPTYKIVDVFVRSDGVNPELEVVAYEDGKPCVARIMEDDE